MADVTLTVVIPEARVAEFTAGFLHKHPQPTEEENPTDAALTPKQWAEKVLRRWAGGQAKRGLYLKTISELPADTNEYVAE